MQKVCPAGSDVFATIGSGGYSEPWRVGRGLWFVHVDGTLSTATVTLQLSPDGGTTWETFAVDLDGSETGVDQVWDDSDGKPKLRCFRGNDMYYRISVEAAGSPAVQVRVSGDNVHIKRAGAV